MAAVPPQPLVCDVSGLTGADLHAVADLARLYAAARRLNLQLIVRNASAELVELVAFVGLADVLRLELEGEAEEGKERRGVEEEGQLGDLPG
jgi:anti-anti-sigma regulatory factor